MDTKFALCALIVGCSTAVTPTGNPAVDAGPMTAETGGTAGRGVGGFSIAALGTGGGRAPGSGGEMPGTGGIDVVTGDGDGDGDGDGVWDYAACNDDSDCNPDHICGKWVVDGFEMTQCVLVCEGEEPVCPLPPPGGNVEPNCAGAPAACMLPCLREDQTCPDGMVCRQYHFAGAKKCFFE